METLLLWDYLDEVVRLLRIIADEPEGETVFKSWIGRMEVADTSPEIVIGKDESGETGD